MKTVRQAAILAGGKGTRLMGAGAGMPKPLLEVCGRPFLDHVMQNLRRFGFDEFLILASYQSGLVLEKYSDHTKFVKELGAKVKVIVEPVPMGTGGALKHAARYLQDEFLLVNGDSIFDFNYLDLCTCPRDGEPEDWLARMALLPVENAARYGLVTTEGTTVKALREKPGTAEVGLINSGVYWLRSGLLDFIGNVPCSLEEDALPVLAARGRLIGRAYEGYFIDIGIPEDLQRARNELVSGLSKPAAFLDRDGTLNHDSGYTHQAHEFRWIEGAKAAIKLLNDSGYLVFIVTNQSGIARGYFDSSAVEALHDSMQSELAATGAHIDDFRFCPHHPEGTVPEWSIVCECRKPGTGMLHSLIDQWHPDMSRSFMLGDSDKDALAGKAAGISSKKISPGAILREVENILGTAPPAG